MDNQNTKENQPQVIEMNVLILVLMDNQNTFRNYGAFCI